MGEVRFSKEIDMQFLKKNVDRKDNYQHYSEICKSLGEQKKVKIPCPVCEKENDKRNIFINVYGLEYIQCSNCTHVYQDYVPDNLSWDKNSLDVLERMSKQLYEDPTKREYRIQKVVRPKLEFALSHFPSDFSGKWLDVGCGTGELIKLLQDYGWNSSGIDNNQSSIEYAKSNYNIDIFDGDVAKTDKDFFNSYDVISIFLLFEHLYSPRDFFRNIAEGCKSGCRIVTEINNAASFSSLIQKTFNNSIDRHLLPCSHTNMFTPQSANFFFESFGFNRLSEWWFGQDFFELKVALDYSREENEILELGPKEINNFQKIIDRMKFSDRIILIYEKP